MVMSISPYIHTPAWGHFDGLGTVITLRGKCPACHQGSAESRCEYVARSSGSLECSWDCDCTRWRLARHVRQAHAGPDEARLTGLTCC